MRMKFQTGLLAASLAGMPAIAAAKTAGPLQVPSPDWRDQIIYFVLTDRFADGDPSNNDQGAGEYNPAKASHFNGGDLAGVRSKLDYIQGLGATTLWLTPPVLNQWWSAQVQYAGYHGYWATDFSKIDPHLGTLADYQALSRDLHGRGMYLVQDIVLNHTGNFFGYQGPYDARDTARNFVLYEKAGSRQPAPSQPPFDLINRLDPAHAKAAVYHWTPPVQDGTNQQQEFTYQVGQLADLNTSNPQVRQVLKQSYRDWLELAGVDAYRIDTAKYVEHDFWRDFLHAPDGIFAKAKALGKQHFLAFGEVFEPSAPFSNEGERKLLTFLGTEQDPLLNSVIAFPLHFELNKVLAEGLPPAQLTYRLEQHVRLFAQPHLLPTFLNNHDTKRFLAAGSPAAFLQAYALMLTIPGIPVIYQGDEQLLAESRQAMFQGGWGAGKDAFDTAHPMYRHIQSLTALRRANKVFSRGDWQLLQAQADAPGILAYQMTSADERALVILNTADSPRLLAALPLDATGAELLWQTPEAGFAAQLRSDAAGRLTLTLPARAVLVLKPSNHKPGKTAPASQGGTAPAASLQLNAPPDTTLTHDIVLTGSGATAGQQVLPVLNGQLDRLAAVQADAKGQFRFTLPVRDLGSSRQSLRLYEPATGALSEAWSYQTNVSQAQWQATVADPAGDDKGPDGQYRQPQQEQSQRQLDMLGVTAKAGGAVLELELKMAQVSQFWAPPNGFDNVHFAIFFHLPAAKELPAATALPGLNTVMPGQKNWQLGHFLFGWGNAVFNARGADAVQTGEKLGAAPRISVDAKAGILRIRYDANALGLPGWEGASIYLSTWDKSGEGVLRSIETTPAPWTFTASRPDAPKVLDDLWLQLKAAR